MIALIFALAQAAQTPALPAVCQRADVVSMAVPLRHGDAASPSITYRYQYIEATPQSMTAPTVIILPGGPGQAGIGNAGSALTLGAVPLTVNRIYTDPRGVGCNANDAMADTTTLTTESLARDVIEIIKARKLDNYTIYGASYGTVLATTVAGMIARDEVRPPRAVVLEGVVGRAFPDFATYMSEFTREWRRMRPLLPNAWGARLSADSLPYGYSATQYGALLAATLIIGDVAAEPYKGTLIEYALAGLDRYHDLKRRNALSELSGADSAAMAYVEARMGIYGGFAQRPVTPSRASLFRNIGCDELWGDWQNGRALRRGELVAEGANICSAKKTNAFESADWQFPFPTYYFQGPFDPTSTLAGARYHFENHPSAPRTFVLVKGASHAPLTGGLKPCAARLWAEMVQGKELPQSLFAPCPRQVDLERRGARNEE